MRTSERACLRASELACERACVLARLGACVVAWLLGWLLARFLVLRVVVSGGCCLDMNDCMMQFAKHAQPGGAVVLWALHISWQRGVQRLPGFEVDDEDWASTFGRRRTNGVSLQPLAFQPQPRTLKEPCRSRFPSKPMDGKDSPL